MSNISIHPIPRRPDEDWKKDLYRDGTRVFRQMIPVPYPDNDREMIIDHLFQVGGAVNEIEHWRLVPGPGCSEQRWRVGYAPLAVWTSAGAGSELILRGELEADLTGFAFLKVRALAARQAHVSVYAEIDGRVVEVVPGLPGVDDYGEFTGAVQGRHLSAVEVHFIAPAAGPVCSSVMWVMLVKPGQPTPIVQPDPAWSGFLSPEVPVDPQPRVSLFFDSEGLQRLRQQLHSPCLAAQWSEKVREAEGYLGDVPEATANPVIPYDAGQYGRPNVTASPFASPFPRARALAYVGLIEKRPDLLRMAARWALTWTRCERWVQYGIEALPGVPLSHGRFAQSYAAAAVAMILDWAGDLLTDAGRQLLAQTLHDKGIVDIDGIMQPGSYVRTMNQGVVFEHGRFLAAYAVRDFYPDELARRIEDARQMIHSVFSTAIKPDGVSEEGPAYLNYTLYFVPELLHVLARASGRSVLAETPSSIAASARWAYANLRTDSAEPRLLSHADGNVEARFLPPPISAFFAGPLSVREWQSIVRAAYPASTDPLYLEHITLVPAQLEAIPAPRLTVFRDAGQVDVRQSDPHAGLRLFFLSGARGGHAHDDKNSFILEAFGQTLLIDRGTPCYTHPDLPFSKLSEAHNTVAPDGLSQNAVPGQPAADLLRVEAQGAVVIIESDAANAWPGLGRKVLRRLIHLRPATLVVEDWIEWERPATTRQYWQSYHPWRAEGGTWVTAAEGVELRVQVLLGAGATISAAPYSVDDLLRPVQRLTVEMPPAGTARIITLLQARPNSTTAWDCEANYDAGSNTLHLLDGEGHRRAIVWAGENIHLQNDTE